MKTVREGDFLVAFPDGRITANNANALKAELNRLMRDSNNRIMVDVDAVEYISSAGLRVFHKISKSMQTPLIVRNASPEVYDIFEVTGFTEQLEVHKALRSISVEGLPVIGAGATAKVYRIDRETVVKVFNPNTSMQIIRQENERSKNAFLGGIPTAISYDLVKAGDCYGSVYELLDAQFGVKTVQEWGYLPYADDRILKEHYTLVKQRMHSCERCGNDMRKISNRSLSRVVLTCPECGGRLERDPLQILWD